MRSKMIILVAFLSQTSLYALDSLGGDSFSKRLERVTDFDLMSSSVRKIVVKRIQFAKALKSTLEKEYDFDISSVGFDAIFNPERPDFFIFYTESPQHKYFECAPQAVEPWKTLSNTDEELIIEYRVPNYELRVISLASCERKSIQLDGVPLSEACSALNILEGKIENKDARLKQIYEIEKDLNNSKKYKSTYVRKFQTTRLISALIKLLGIEISGIMNGDFNDSEVANLEKDLAALKNQVKAQLDILFADIERQNLSTEGLQAHKLIDDALSIVRQLRSILLNRSTIEIR